MAKPNNAYKMCVRDLCKQSEAKLDSITAKLIISDNFYLFLSLATKQEWTENETKMMSPLKKNIKERKTARTLTRGLQGTELCFNISKMNITSEQ